MITLKFCPQELFSCHHSQKELFYSQFQKYFMFMTPDNIHFPHLGFFAEKAFFVVLMGNRDFKIRRLRTTDGTKIRTGTRQVCSRFPPSQAGDGV